MSTLVTEPRPSAKSVWTNRIYAKMFTAYAISSFGEWFDAFAIQVLVAYRWQADPIMIALIPVMMALPGILLGVAIFSLIMVIPGARVLYGTIWLLFIGLFIAAVPIAIRGAEGSVKQIGIELYEASRVNGAGRARGWLGTIAPLLKPGVGAAWFIAAVIIASNVAVPLLLSTPRTSVLAVEALVRYREGFVQLASAMILVNLLVWVLAYLAIVLANLIGASITERRNRARAKEHIELLEPKSDKDEVWS